MRIKNTSTLAEYPSENLDLERVETGIRSTSVTDIHNCLICAVRTGAALTGSKSYVSPRIDNFLYDRPPGDGCRPQYLIAAFDHLSISA